MSHGQELALGVVLTILLVRWLVPDAHKGSSKLQRIWSAAWNTPITPLGDVLSKHNIASDLLVQALAKDVKQMRAAGWNDSQITTALRDPQYGLTQAQIDVVMHIGTVP